ncbi:MAG: hypothetical protein KGS49_03060 [Planctomycetes bacterium]|nr:hypothetical protein [Planctomycetota bacterium]
MKSERSQIQESDLLADKIEQRFTQIKPYLPALLGTIGVVVLGLLGYGIYSSQKETRAARAWTDFYFSDTSPQDLEAIAGDFSDTSAGTWAKLTAGDANMAKALEKWNVDRTVADQYFTQAVDDYRAAAKSSTEPFTKGRALFGLAQALEGLGERKEAIIEYKRLASEGVTEDIAAEAKRRLAWLEGKEAEVFFAWYRDRTNAAPAASNPGGRPSIPGLPDFAFPPASGGSPSGLPALPPANNPPSQPPATEPAPAAEPVPAEPAPATEPAPAEPAPMP